MATIQVEVNVMDLPEVKELVIAFNERCKELHRERERYREALDKLAKLGNGDRYGNSVGNEIAIRALNA